MSTVPADPKILERNLAAIAKRSPAAAAHIQDAAPSTELEFSTAPTGDIVAVMDNRALCSKRNPSRESQTWAQQYDPQTTGFLGVLGFGLGHHLRALNEAHSNQSVILCFEPDVRLLRAVLERVDHSDWIRTSMFLLATDPTDAPAISRLIHNAEAFIATGVELAPHPPSQRRLGDSAQQFSSTLLDVIRSTRTHLVTVLAHSGITLRNILMNAGTYANASGITPLKDSCKGRAAILIAAGPSLQRNLQLLEDPSVRDRFVIIAVQTMLKPLLERGIRPHFVTALDHHEISKRFYEGLTAEDVEGVRLVVEPKANAAIIQAFPGEVLCASEPQLDLLLGDELNRDMGTLPAGATVAHLNYYLARYLGCSTVILIGQDLGFTDGQYYASGAAIHRVWAGELSEHRTLEMFEWERIARMKNLLRIKSDIYGRHIYTDEQMSTYIAQFEKDFKEDTAGSPDLRIINATEGGVNIRHTQALPLSKALQDHRSPAPIAIPDTKHHAIQDDQRNFRIKSRLELVIRQLTSIENFSQKTLDLISDAQSDIENPSHVDRCITKIHTIRDDVMASEPGFGLVNFINQKGGLDRFKVDRQIALLKDLPEIHRQAKQLERDANNVRWIKDSAIQVRELVERSLAVFADNAQPMTRDEFADETALDIDAESQVKSTRRVEAVIFVDPDLGPLGTPRNLDQPIHQGLNALELTIKRLARSNQLDGITVITPSPDRINAMRLDSDPKPIRVVACDPGTFRARAQSVGQARLSSSECWRGSIASLACYDESLEPTALARVMDEHRIDAAAIVSSDAAMIDPQLVDEIVARHRADPEHCRIPFSQAVPGLGCVILDKDAAHTLAHASQRATVLSSIGAMLGYIPIGPQGDPIASPLCVGIDPLLRDAGVRVIPDSTLRLQAMTAAYQGLGDFAMAASTPVLLKAYCKELKERQSAIPSRLVLELSSSRTATGIWGDMHEQPQQQQTLDTDAARELITQASTLNPDITLLLAGRGDPLNHPDALELITHAKQSGIQSIELRTDLLNQPFTPEQLASAGLSAISVDILADTPGTYETMTGSPHYEQLLDQMQSLFNARTSTAEQLPLPWVLPRITRCDEVYNDIQNFYDRWLTVCGCATIDPPPPGTPGRIQQLTIPSERANQLHHNTLRIQADGQIVDHTQTPLSTTAGPINAIALGIQNAYTQMRSVVQCSSSTTIEPKANTQPAYTP